MMFRRRHNVRTETGGGTGCILSPYGTKDTLDGCLQEPNTACGSAWRCAKEGGESDVYGNHKEVGSPLFTKRIEGEDFYETEEECKCYMCDPTGNTGSCVPTTDGKNGISFTEAGCETCMYACNSTGGKQSATVGDLGTGFENVNCWACNGTAGPDSTCELVAAGTLGTYSSRDTCDSNVVARCGWGYGANGSTCELTETAPRGTSAASCNITNVAGWKYGCFDKFARAEGICVGVPHDYAGDVFTSLDACNVFGVNDMQIIHKHDSEDFSAGLNQNAIIKFGPGKLETRGNATSELFQRVWFDSIQDYITGNGTKLPSVSLGFRVHKTTYIGSFIGLLISVNLVDVPFSPGSTVVVTRSTDNITPRRIGNFQKEVFFNLQTGTIFSLKNDIEIKNNGGNYEIGMESLTNTTTIDLIITQI